MLHIVSSSGQPPLPVASHEISRSERCFGEYQFLIQIGGGRRRAVAFQKELRGFVCRRTHNLEISRHNSVFMDVHNQFSTRERNGGTIFRN